MDSLECPICFLEYNSENNLPLKTFCCNKTICLSCIEQSLNSVGRCPWDKRRWVGRNTFDKFYENTPDNYLEQLLNQYNSDCNERCTDTNTECPLESGTTIDCHSNSVTNRCNSVHSRPSYYELGSGVLREEYRNKINEIEKDETILRKQLEDDAQLAKKLSEEFLKTQKELSKLSEKDFILAKRLSDPSSSSSGKRVVSRSGSKLSTSRSSTVDRRMSSKFENWIKANSLSTNNHFASDSKHSSSNSSGINKNNIGKSFSKAKYSILDAFHKKDNSGEMDKQSKTVYLRDVTTDSNRRIKNSVKASCETIMLCDDSDDSSCASNIIRPCKEVSKKRPLVVVEDDSPDYQSEYSRQPSEKSPKKSDTSEVVTPNNSLLQFSGPQSDGNTSDSLISYSLVNVVYQKGASSSSDFNHCNESEDSSGKNSDKHNKETSDVSVGHVDNSNTHLSNHSNSSDSVPLRSGSADFQLQESCKSILEENTSCRLLGSNGDILNNEKVLNRLNSLKEIDVCQTLNYNNTNNSADDLIDSNRNSAEVKECKNINEFVSCVNMIGEGHPEMDCAEKENSWNCTKCTFENNTTSLRCELCCAFKLSRRIKGKVCCN